MTTRVNLSPVARTTKGALISFLGPRLAQDQKLPDLNPILSDLTRKNFEVMIPVIDRRVRSAVRGKLAQDMAIDDMPEMLEHVREEGEDEEVDQPGMEDLGSGHPDEVANEPFPEAHDSDPMLIGKIKELLAGHVAPELLARIDEMAGANEDARYDAMEDDECYDRRADDFRAHGGRDETPEEMAEREEGEDRRREADDRRPRSADDRKRAEDSRKRRHARDKRRADDARRRLGRDESPEEAEDRRKRHRAEDRKRAVDALRRRAEDRRRDADDARKHADDAKGADDRRRAEDRKRRAEDRARRAEDSYRRVAGDEPPEFPGRPETGGTMTEDKVKSIARRAHDEAIQQMRGAQDARSFVRPWVGEFRTDLAMDSADEVYRQTLKALGVTHGADWPTDALRALVAAQPTAQRPGYTPTTLATDAAPAGGGFGKRFAFTQRVGTDG